MQCSTVSNSFSPTLSRHQVPFELNLVQPNSRTNWSYTTQHYPPCVHGFRALSCNCSCGGLLRCFYTESDVEKFRIEARSSLGASYHRKSHEWYVRMLIMPSFSYLFRLFRLCLCLFSD
mmetsp:Transcript_40796/g.102683  ORF Transcript_40796/g.102683 Transcript_40796/m.102683 type:complete len:119 (+) Transcript_40796:36-392(+)